MPYQDSIMPARNFNIAVGSVILHLARTTSSKENLQKLITSLLIRMQRQRCKNTINYSVSTLKLSKDLQILQNMPFNCFEFLNLNRGFLLIKVYLC